MDFIHPMGKLRGVWTPALNLIAFAALSAGGAIVCVAQQTKPPEPTPEVVAVSTVTVDPDHVTLSPGDTKSFSATVTGTGAFSHEVTWTVNDVVGGNVKLGTISSNGRYVTPYPIPATVTVKAVSNSDPKKWASAVITLVAPAPAQGPALTVDLGTPGHPISPLIYGMNAYRQADPEHEAAQVAKAVRLSVNRWGGNGTSRYNYKLDVSNSGDDWFFEIDPNKNTQFPDVSEFNTQVLSDRASGAKTMGTMPVMGWVAKSRTRAASFSVAKYGPQQKTDPYWWDFGNGVKPDGTNITNDPTDTCMPVDEIWAADWVKYLVKRFGDAAHGGVAIYSLDNEPTWWNKNHRDVHPLPFTYDEVTENGLKVAKAIKAADPTAEVSGPVIDYWPTYFYSGKDLESIYKNWPNFAKGPVDRMAHGNLPLIDYYLREFKGAQDADPHHTRLLDYLDLHTYFAANDAGLKPAGTSEQQAAVIDSTRVFWDSTYTDRRFQNPDKYLEPLAPQMIPRMKKWVADNYPGTKTAITEYNWGGPEHISGAVAQADILGIFGREGLDLGALWGPPNLNEPLMFAFKIFRNYDDAGGQFGDMSRTASSADQRKLSVYAASDSGNHSLTLMVINKTFGDLKTDVSLDQFKAAGPAKVFQYSSANLAGIQSLPPIKATGPANNRNASVLKEQAFPAMSMTLYVIPQQ
jgi:hypothetical protein